MCLCSFLHQVLSGRVCTLQSVEGIRVRFSVKESFKDSDWSTLVSVSPTTIFQGN
uniref:Uncharacterized protein n=1 Tax=Arundo donax TaxID=35708 RepID=A0A0A9FDQ9_ARUDO